MVRKLALMVAGFVLLSATAGLAAPRAAEGGDKETIAVTQIVLQPVVRQPASVSSNVQPSHESGAARDF